MARGRRNLKKGQRLSKYHQKKWSRKYNGMMTGRPTGGDPNYWTKNRARSGNEGPPADVDPGINPNPPGNNNNIIPPNIEPDLTIPNYECYNIKSKRACIMAYDRSCCYWDIAEDQCVTKNDFGIECNMESKIDASRYLPIDIDIRIAGWHDSSHYDIMDFYPHHRYAGYNEVGPDHPWYTFVPESGQDYSFLYDINEAGDWSTNRYEYPFRIYRPACSNYHNESFGQCPPNMSLHNTFGSLDLSYLELPPENFIDNDLSDLTPLDYYESYAGVSVDTKVMEKVYQGMEFYTRNVTEPMYKHFYNSMVAGTRHSLKYGLTDAEIEMQEYVDDFNVELAARHPEIAVTIDNISGVYDMSEYELQYSTALAGLKNKVDSQFGIWETNAKNYFYANQHGIIDWLVGAWLPYENGKYSWNIREYPASFGFTPLSNENIWRRFAGLVTVGALGYAIDEYTEDQGWHNFDDFIEGYAKPWAEQKAYSYAVDILSDGWNEEAESLKQQLGLQWIPDAEFIKAAISWEASGGDMRWGMVNIGLNNFLNSYVKHEWNRKFPKGLFGLGLNMDSIKIWYIPKDYNMTGNEGEDGGNINMLGYPGVFEPGVTNFGIKVNFEMQSIKRILNPNLPFGAYTPPPLNREEDWWKSISLKAECPEGGHNDENPWDPESYDPYCPTPEEIQEGATKPIFRDNDDDSSWGYDEEEGFWPCTECEWEPNPEWGPNGYISTRDNYKITQDYIDENELHDMVPVGFDCCGIEDSRDCSLQPGCTWYDFRGNNINGYCFRTYKKRCIDAENPNECRSIEGCHALAIEGGFFGPQQTCNYDAIVGIIDGKPPEDDGGRRRGMKNYRMETEYKFFNPPFNSSDAWIDYSTRYFSEANPSRDDGNWWDQSFVCMESEDYFDNKLLMELAEQCDCTGGHYNGCACAQQISMIMTEPYFQNDAWAFGSNWGDCGSFWTDGDCNEQGYGPAWYFDDNPYSDYYSQDIWLGCCPCDWCNCQIPVQTDQAGQVTAQLNVNDCSNSPFTGWTSDLNGLLDCCWNAHDLTNSVWWGGGPGSHAQWKNNHRGLDLSYGYECI